MVQAGRELARALLEGLLNVGEGGGDAQEQKTFPYLVVGCSTLYLHTFCSLFSTTEKALRWTSSDMRDCETRKS